MGANKAQKYFDGHMKACFFCPCDFVVVYSQNPFTESEDLTNNCTNLYLCKAARWKCSLGHLQIPLIFLLLVMKALGYVFTHGRFF